MKTKIVVDSTCNGHKFCMFIVDLIAVIKRNKGLDGAWLIMDNARIHKTQELKEIIQDSLYQLEFLSPYSYMLNPIENLFSKVKAEVRNMFSESEGKYSLKDLIETGVGTVTQSDCTNYVYLSCSI